MHLLDQQLNANIRGDFKRGWELSEELWRTDPTDHRTAFNRGWHVLSHGDLQGGMELIDRGRQINVFGSRPLGSIRPMYDPRKHELRGKTIILRSEGGLGDEIINVRFAEDFAARGAKVVVSAHSSLASLFARMPSVAAVTQSGNELGVYHDFWVPAMSAVRFTNHTYQTLNGAPYLSPAPDRKEMWRSVIQAPRGELKVGIRWSGNPEFEHEQHRRFPPEGVIGLESVPGVRLFSFQKDTDTRALPERVMDLQLFLSSWEDTAGALSNLDLMITSCTSVAHMSAALGVETWVIVPILPYYLWALPGSTSPWYKTVRLFRQKKFGDWSETLSEVRNALEERARATSLRA